MRVFRTFNAASEAVPARERAARVAGRRRDGGGAMTHKLTDGGHVLPRRDPRPGRGRGRRCTSPSATARCADVQLRIYEPPRFFEAFLRGRAHTEPPDITARICGICPVAYQMSACWAIEDACGVSVHRRDPARCAGCSTAASGSRATRCTSTCCTPRTSSATTARSRWPADHPAVVERGLRLKKAGNALMDRRRRPLGAPGQRPGRRLLPAADRGGAARDPRRTLEQALEDALETVRAGRRLRLPRLRAALRVPRAAAPTAGYPIESGSVVTTSGCRPSTWRDFADPDRRGARARTPTRCTPGSTAACAGRTSSARWPATP